MIGTRERILPGISRNFWFQFFDLQIHFYHNHFWINTSVRKSGRDESPILDDVSFRLIIKDWGSTWQCLPFCWSSPGYWKKRWQQNKGTLILRWGFEAPAAHSLSPFFSWQKRINFKNSLDLTLITGFFRSA